MHFPRTSYTRAGCYSVYCRRVFLRVYAAACAGWFSYPGLLPGAFATESQKLAMRLREFFGALGCSLAWRGCQSSMRLNQPSVTSLWD